MNFALSRTFAFTVSTLALATLSGSAHAQLESQGGNNVDEIMQRLLNPSKFGLNQGEWQDGRCGNITFVPTSSGAIERLMCSGDRAIGAMARPLIRQLVCSPGCIGGTDGKLSQGRIAANQITLMRNNGGNDAQCDTQISGQDWKVAIRTIFAGNDGSGSPEACASEERKALVNNWAALWSNGCSQPSACTQLHHLYRPDERSGMAQVFAFLVGIRGYCNGGAQEDKDPIRRPCRDDERYCSADGTLGVVLPIKIPVPAKAQTDDYFAAINNTKPCKRGDFTYTFSDPVADASGICPDGSEQVATYLCLYPTDEQGLLGCNNEVDNPSPVAPLMDGRVYNEIPQLPDSGYPGDEATVGDYREFYRIHAGCKDGGRSSSDQLGCITRQSQCSIGLGNMRIQQERANNAGLGFVQLDENTIGTPRYPLTQFFYVNTINGYDTAVGEEAKLVDCLENHPEWVKAAVEDAGFASFPQVDQRPIPCDGDGTPGGGN